MLLVNLLKVVQGNCVLSLPRSLLDPVRAHLGRALDVDNSRKINDFVHFHQVVVELEVHGVLCLVEDLAVLHDAGEDVTIGEEGPFGDPNSIASHLAVLSPLVNSAHKGVDLKGEAPALGILVVESEEVDIFVLSDILPLCERLVENGQFWEVLPDDFEHS